MWGEVRSFHGPLQLLPQMLLIGHIFNKERGVVSVYCISLISLELQQMSIQSNDHIKLSNNCTPQT